MPLKKQNILSIDLGTSNSASAWSVEDGNVVTVLNCLDADPCREQVNNNKENFKNFSSEWHCDEKGEIISVGTRYLEGAEKRPPYVITGVKRLLARTYLDAKASGELDRYPRVKPDRRNGQCLIQIGEKTYSPQQLLTELYSHIKASAETQFTTSFNSVVITSPANWNQDQVSMLIDAARNAGFENVRNMSEPVAAAHALEVDVQNRVYKTHVVDMGAGTLDISTGYMFRNENNEYQFQPIANIGHNNLGGSDFLERLVEFVMKITEVGEVTNGDLAVIRYVCELGMMELSDKVETTINFSLSDRDYQCTIDRNDFKSALQGGACQQDLLEEFRRYVNAGPEKSGWRPEDVEVLILIGGPTRMPAIVECLEIIYTNNQLVTSQLASFVDGGQIVNRMNAVAIGAAMSVNRIVQDIVPAGYGIENLDITDGSMIYTPKILIPRDSHSPYKSEEYSIGWYAVNGLYDFKIILHVPESDHGKYEYRFVNIVKFATATPEFCQLVVQMELTQNKELLISIQNKFTNEIAKFISLPSANVGVTYPLEVSRLPLFSQKRVEPVEPTDEILARFSAWVTSTRSYLDRKIALSPIPQMDLSQTSDEVMFLIKREILQDDYRPLYTKIRVLINNCKARGLLTIEEGNKLMSSIAAFEKELFDVRAVEDAPKAVCLGD